MKRIPNEVPPCGTLYYKFDDQNLQSGVISTTNDKNLIKIRFSDLPVSKATTQGLYKASFHKMTETQRASIPHALAGRVMVVCARTGSGKTLSYLIPVVEALYR